MERCRRMLQLLSAYLDEELEPDLCQEFEHHLEYCDPCRVIMRTTRISIQFCRRMKALPMPPGVCFRLRRMLRQRLFPEGDEYYEE